MEMQQKLGSINTIMFTSADDDKGLDATLAFSIILPNQISKKDLELLLNKFI